MMSMPSSRSPTARPSSSSAPPTRTARLDCGLEWFSLITWHRQASREHLDHNSRESSVNPAQTSAPPAALVADQDDEIFGHRELLPGSWQTREAARPSSISVLPALTSIAAL